MLVYKAQVRTNNCHRIKQKNKMNTKEQKMSHIRRLKNARNIFKMISKMIFNYFNLAFMLSLGTTKFQEQYFSEREGNQAWIDIWKNLCILWCL